MVGVVEIGNICINIIIIVDNCVDGVGIIGECVVVVAVIIDGCVAYCNNITWYQSRVNWISTKCTLIVGIIITTVISITVVNIIIIIWCNCR